MDREPASTPDNIGENGMEVERQHRRAENDPVQHSPVAGGIEQGDGPAHAVAEDDDSLGLLRPDDPREKPVEVGDIVVEGVDMAFAAIGQQTYSLNKINHEDRGLSLRDVPRLYNVKP